MITCRTGIISVALRKDEATAIGRLQKFSVK
jgi:Fe2+ transport system protein FeoA